MSLTELAKYCAPMLLAIAAYLGDRYIKLRDRAREKINKPAFLNQDGEIKLRINDLLIKIIGYTQASRVAIYEYSNGTYTHGGTSLEYIDCTYEKTDDYIKPIIQEFKRVPISPFLVIIMDIEKSESGWTKVTDTDKNKEIRKIQKLFRTSQSYNFKISDSVWDGVLTVSWMGTNGNIDLTEEEVQHLRDCTYEVKLLMQKLKRK